MANIVGPNEVRVTGENSFIRLASSTDGEFTTVASHWRVLFSPVGPGSLTSRNKSFAKTP